MTHPTPQEVATRLAEIYGGTNAAADKLEIGRNTLSKIRAGKLQPAPGLEAMMFRHLKALETPKPSPFGKLKA